MTVGVVNVVVPAGWDDPERPSGGNRYDQRLCAGLVALGWSVVLHEVAGPWPRPGVADLADLGAVLDRLPVHTLVVVDGLVGSAAAQVLVPRADRLRLVLLVHVPLGDGTADAVDPGTDAGEHEVLESAAAVLTTSRWTRRRLLDGYGLWPGDVHVAEPGADRAELTSPSSGGGRLTCVAGTVRHKGHDTLLDAAGRLRDLDWHLTCVGPTDREPGVVESLRARADSLRLADRVVFVGPKSDHDLAEAYRGTDLLVVPSRTEAYGMVVTEGLARGIPVMASEVGGLPEALGRTSADLRPGVLVPVDDVDAWAAALRRWLEDDDLRADLRCRAAERRDALKTWTATAARVSGVLERVG